MRFVIFGLTLSSSWGNGHATLWRGLARALVRQGHHDELRRLAERARERVLDEHTSAHCAHELIRLLEAASA